MRPRQGLIELFSTFVQFDADRFNGWVADPRLKRSIEKALNSQLPSSSIESFWALYWHKQWEEQTTQLAKNHLLAYLQEPCYWVAQKAAHNFTSSQYSLTDCFQLATIQIDKVLKGFDAQQGFNLKSYASAAFNSIIRDHLRQKGEVDICTDWSLLRKVSQKRLCQALEQRGISSTALDSYVLAWTCFKTCYVPNQKNSTRRLEKPGSEVWAAIATLYGAERYTNLAKAGEAISAKQIESWMSTCAKAIRDYLYPASVSINAPTPGHGSSEFIDQLTQSDQLTPLTHLISQEEQDLRQQQQTDLSNLLQQMIEALDPGAKSLLQLYYSGSTTQQQIAAELNLKQYAISRQLGRIRKALLLGLTTWSQETLHITPSSDVLKYTSVVLEEWLQHHFAGFPQPAAD